MKRNMDLVRQILLFAEEQNKPTIPDINGFSEEEVAYHCEIMEEAGLLVLINLSTCSSSCYSIDRLTWIGHEFLDSARNESFWKKVCAQIANKVAGASFAITAEYLAHEVKRQLGLIP